MKFQAVEIINFRNFDKIKINLANKNIFFGLNDVGKTNFISALRYIFDKDFRKKIYWILIIIIKKQTTLLRLQ